MWEKKQLKNEFFRPPSFELPYTVATTALQTTMDIPVPELAKEKVDYDVEEDTEGEVFVVKSEENLLDTAIY